MLSSVLIFVALTMVGCACAGSGPLKGPYTSNDLAINTVREVNLEPVLCECHRAVANVQDVEHTPVMGCYIPSRNNHGAVASQLKAAGVNDPSVVEYSYVNRDDGMEYFIKLLDKTSDKIYLADILIGRPTKYTLLKVRRSRGSESMTEF